MDNLTLITLMTAQDLAMTPKPAIPEHIKLCEVQPDKSKFSLTAFDGSPCIFYGNVPIWRSQYPLEAIDFFIPEPEEYEEEYALDEYRVVKEPYTLMCIDSWTDLYTYGNWETLEELKAWLKNPKSLY